MNRNNLTGINKFSSDLALKANITYVDEKLSHFSNVDNTSDLNKPLSHQMQNSLDTKVDKDNNEIDGVGTFTSIIGDAINGFFTVITVVTVFGSIQSQLAGLQAQISALGSTISGIQGSIASLWTALNAIKFDVETLQLKTYFQSVFLNQTLFNSDVIVTDDTNNNTIELFNDGSISCVGDINTQSNVVCKECICENKLTTDDLKANGIIETNDIQSISNILNLKSNIININSDIGYTINIGNEFSNTYIRGNLICQDTNLMFFSDGTINQMG